MHYIAVGVGKYLHFHVARLDNLFFSGGEGIQPEDIERVLLQYPGIQQAFVVPQVDAEFGHRPVAVIDVADEVDEASLSDWLIPQLAVFQRPIAFYRLPAALKQGGIKVSRQAVIDFVAKLI